MRMRFIAFPAPEKKSKKHDDQTDRAGNGKCDGRSEIGGTVSDGRIGNQPAGGRPREMSGAGFSALVGRRRVRRAASKKEWRAAPARRRPVVTESLLLSDSTENQPRKNVFANPINPPTSTTHKTSIFNL